MDQPGGIALFKRILHISKKNNLVRFGIILVILAVSAALSQIMPLAIGWITDSVIEEMSIAFGVVLPYLFIILAAILINELIKIVRRLMVEDMATRTEKDARQQAINALLKAPLYYFRQNMTGNIHGRLNRSLEGTATLIKLIFMDLAPSIATAAAAVVVIFTQLPLPIALVTVLVIPTGTLIVVRQIKAQKGIRVSLFQSKADMDGMVVELLGGIETIRITDSADFEDARFETRSEALRSKEMRHHKAMAGYDCLKFLNEAVFNVLVIGLSVWLATQGTISVGTILTAYLCFTQLTGPLKELHRILDELSECTVQANEYFKIIDIPTDFTYQPIEKNTLAAADSRGITVEHLQFAYPEMPKDIILKDISLSIAPGEFIGIAGYSGCGKSSFIKTLAKLEPYKGAICYGGLSLAKITRSEIAHIVSLVPQSPFIISDTIYNNICYGCKRKVGLDEVKQAAQKAYIDQDIERLPGSYDFVVSEGGGNLSGGQRQRLSLARVFLQQPQILILDEATSALDNVSEKHVQKHLEEMNTVCGTTILSIAHRLTTLQNCDRILVFDEGAIVQQGSYQQLRSEVGLFQDMATGKRETKP